MAKQVAWWVSYVVGVLIFILVGCEIFLRFSLPNPQGYFVYPPHSVFKFVPDPVNTPGIEGVSHFVANSLGMRADEIPPGAKRSILVFGGSTAIDVYLDQPKMWSHLVQDKLNATPGQPKTWVGNIARPSLATIHNLLEFDRNVPSLPHMDMFVNLVGVNDFQIALRSSYLRKLTLEDNLNWTFTVRPRSGWRNRFALYRFYERIKDWWKRSRNSVVLTEYATIFAEWRSCRQSAPKENLVDLPNLDDGLANYRSNLNKLIDRSEAYHAPMIFLTQPTLWKEQMAPEDEALLTAGGVGGRDDWCTKKIYYSPAALARGMKMFNDVLLDVCDKRKIFCIDLAARVPKERRYFFDDMHYSEAGAQLVSDVVAACIIDFSAKFAHNPAH
jgi:lysophospholipase L1-like esterase